MKFGLLLALLASTGAGAAPDCTAEGNLSVTFLANEGFLLRAAGTGVLVDAFVIERHAGYGALSGELAAALRTASPPFDTVRVALASHVHRDHFQPEPARDFLLATSRVRLASTPQVLEALRSVHPALDARLEEVLPAPGRVSRLDFPDVKVEVLRLSHGRNSRVENLGHIIDIGGWRVAHVGDAEPYEDSYAPYALSARGLRLSLIPYWYFQSEDGRTIVAKHLRAPHMIAVHIPPDQTTDVGDALAETYPDVVVPSAAGQSWCLSPPTPVPAA